MKRQKGAQGEIRGAFVSMREQMCHKGEVPTGRANSIGSRGKPILAPAPRVETNRRCVAPSSNFQVAAKILPMVKQQFLASELLGRLDQWELPSELKFDLLPVSD